MTALASAAGADTTGAARRPPRLRRLIWVTWRQHRAALTVLAVLAAALAAIMLAAALLGHAQYATEVRDHCFAAYLPIRCRSLGNGFPNSGNNYYPVGVTLVAWLMPVLTGVFLGAPLLAREYERGTARFAWAQGTSRTRWALASLLTLAVPVVAAAAVLGALAEWSLQPFEVFGDETRWKFLFEATPLTLAAWALFALLLGVTAGVVLRRVVPAMAVAGGAVAALILVNAYKLHYLLLPVGAVRTRAALVPYRPSAPPVNADQFFFAVSVARIRSGSWIVDGWVQGRNGHRLTDPLIDRLWGAKDPLAWLHSHDASAWIRYQPGGHYWALQGLESGALLVPALVLAVVTVLVVRRSST